jgi:hypothetical protein
MRQVRQLERSPSRRPWSSCGAIGASGDRRHDGTLVVSSAKGHVLRRTRDAKWPQHTLSTTHWQGLKVMNRAAPRSRRNPHDGAKPHAGGCRRGACSQAA